MGEKGRLKAKVKGKDKVKLKGKASALKAEAKEKDKAKLKGKASALKAKAKGKKTQKMGRGQQRRATKAKNRSKEESPQEEAPSPTGLGRLFKTVAKGGAKVYLQAMSPSGKKGTSWEWSVRIIMTQTPGECVAEHWDLVVDGLGRILWTS